MKLKYKILISFLGFFVVILVFLATYVSYSFGKFVGTAEGYAETIDSVKRKIEIGYHLGDIKKGFLVTKDAINKPISPYKVYFYVDSYFYGGEDEEYFRVIMRLGKPIEFETDKYGSFYYIDNDQLLPYWYKWHIVNGEGKSVKSWLSAFIKNRDGTYHTIVHLPKEDLSKSLLEIYFEDTDNNGIKDNTTFLVEIPDFLEKRI